MLTLTEIGRSRYLLYRGLTDAGFEAGRAALAVDVLLGPEPEAEAEEGYEPSVEDWEDYVSWSDREDRGSFALEGDDSDYLSDRDVMVVTGCVG